MLLNQEEVFKILRCPKSGHEIELFGDKILTTDNNIKIEYELVDNYPVLIDYDESILKDSNNKILVSPIKRSSYNFLQIFFKRLISPPKKVTLENVNNIMDLLFESNDNPKVLIIGGGTIGQNMEKFYEDPRIGLISFDIYASPNVQFIADAHKIPLPDKTFDGVIIQAVLEHVLEPSTVVSEIYRVLKDNGIVYAETPFLQHVHEGAYDFTRFTESGHRYLFKKFELIKSGVVAGAGTQLLWSLDNFFRGLFRSKDMGKVIKLCFFWLQYLDNFIPESYNIDAASGVFFLGKKAIKELENNEIVSHYKGAQQ
jgi:SAM-dependent methyltransferase